MKITPTLKTIKRQGKSGKRYVFIKINGREAVIPNKYGTKWWEKATQSDIRRVAVR